MITLHEEIVVPRSAKDCFRYVADFRTTTEWDATAVRADKLTPGPVGLGSRFDLDCKAGPTTLQLEYEIEEFQPWHSLVLRGKGRWFDVMDTIVFSERDDGTTHIDYRAEFHYHYGLEKLAGGMENTLRKMGRASLRGLKRALEDTNTLPGTRAATARADKWVAPGVAMFSKLGYRRGRKHWLPTSRFMDGQHVVITGTSSGLGNATAIALAEAGADLTLVIRNPNGVEPLQQQIADATGRTDITIELADLSLMADVEALAQRLMAKGRPIDVLVNNAGALFNERALTDEGLERSFALLLLSPWHLTRLLKPLLADHEAPARVINVISGGMYTEQLKCNKLIMRPETYRGAVAYARCKRALTVLTELWADAWADDNIVVNAMHPGWADTPGIASALPTFRKITQRILRNPQEGADTIIWLARATEAAQVSGKLFLDREIRTPYLLEKTRESVTERNRLEDYLEIKLREATEGHSKADASAKSESDTIATAANKPSDNAA